MSTVHNRLKTIEWRLAYRGAERALLAEEIDGLDDAQAEMALRAETDRLTLLIRLEAEQNGMPNRRRTAEHQPKLF